MPFTEADIALLPLGAQSIPHPGMLSMPPVDTQHYTVVDFSMECFQSALVPQAALMQDTKCAWLPARPPPGGGLTGKR